MWNFDDILSTLCHALREEHDRLTGEQAVHNLDALDEVELHPLLAGALSAAGFGVLREHPYPSEWLSKPGRRKKVLPDESQRLRCDLVLTPQPGQSLIDPLVAKRTMMDDLAAAEGTLYSSIATQRAARAAVAQGLPPDEACWLELKVVGQFCHTAGVPGANRAYASQLLRGTINDLRKLASDAGILHAGALLVLFTQSRAVAEHDLGVLAQKAAGKGVLASMPRAMHTPVLDRIGNTCCTVALLEPRRE